MVYSPVPCTLILTAFLFAFASAAPVVKSLNPNWRPNPLTARSPTPVSASAFTDWATNVVMLGGSQTYGMWIPPDGSWYDLGIIQCLDMPAYAIGPCNIVTIDNIGVATGNGPCSFVGSDGWSATLSGAAGDGYHTVGPPQEIKLAACGS